MQQVIKRVIKQEEIRFENLPSQDYAKAKKLCELLDSGQYTQITCNDITEFMYYVKVLTESEKFTLLIKGNTFVNNSFTVMKTEKP